MLALGGWFKNTICLTRGDTAHLSPLVGDLASPEACLALETTVAQLCDTLSVSPELIAHDLHPDFHSTRLAFELAARHGIATLAVQHHHAHIAAVCAEHGVSGPVIGLALDGVGLGTDGMAWGGELLKVDAPGAERLGHLRPLRLPGADRAAREPWRMAAAALHELGQHDEIAARFSTQPAAATVAAMLQRDLNCPPTSSMGRLFDAAAGLLGLCPVQRFEGEAAILLQQLAEAHGTVPPLAAGYALQAGVLDFLPLLAVLAKESEPARGAALFHATVALGLATWALEALTRHPVDLVVCGGGCFLNRLLLQQLTSHLQSRGVRVLTARQLSPGDGGLSLGQAWVAIQHSRSS
ncbi:MAG: hydrogenase maturation protein HypF [Betaproteobacteria bacterium HGW-Betaproteobacteria-11]|nr:MAG: hydrogenase maturation protein HypF [Betaproteobacteria bacterium HGW-Betaproteobacteria-11]